MTQSYGARVFRGFVTTATAAAFQAVLQFGSLVILARLMDPSDFGLVYPITAVFMILSSFLTAGVEQALVRRAAISADLDRAAMQWLLGSSLVLFGLINIGIPFYLEADESLETRLVFHILTLLLPLNAARAYAHGRLSQRLDFRYLAILSTLQNVLFVVLAVVLAILLRSPLALAIPIVTQWLVCVPFCWRATGALFHALPPRAYFIELLRFGGPMTGAAISLKVVSQLDQMVAGFYATDVAGLYNRASTLAAVPGRITNMMAQQLGLATLAKLGDEPHRLGQAYRCGTVMLGFMGIPMMVFMLYHAGAIMEVVLGREWLPGTTVFILVALTVHVRILRRLPGWVIVGTNHPWSYFYCELFFVFSLGVLCLTIGLESVELLALSVLIAHTTECLLLAVVASRYSTVGLAAFAQAHVGGVVLGLLILIAMYAIDSISVIPLMASWQALIVHILAAVGVAVLTLWLGLLRRIDEDHRWVCDRIEDTIAHLLRRRFAK